MNLLLDTHAFIWSKTNDDRLPPSAWAMLRDPGNQLFISAISIAEMAIKVGIGKLTLDVELSEFLHTGMKNSQISELPLGSSHAIRLATLPLHHRDPFDRLLVATAMEENLTLLTDDVEIRKYPVNLAW